MSRHFDNLAHYHPDDPALSASCLVRYQLAYCDSWLRMYRWYRGMWSLCSCRHLYAECIRCKLARSVQRSSCACKTSSRASACSRCCLRSSRCCPGGSRARRGGSRGGTQDSRSSGCQEQCQAESGGNGGVAGRSASCSTRQGPYVQCLDCIEGLRLHRQAPKRTSWAPFLKKSSEKEKR